MTVKLSALNGVRNDIPLDRFEPGDLEVGSNVDVDETGKVYRRLGSAPVESGSFHSLWSDGGDEGFVVKGTTMYRVTQGGTSSVIATGITHRVRYLKVNDDVYWTDGTKTGVISGGVNHAWGIPVPTLPDVVATYGDMEAGEYLYSMTFVRNNGMESGAPRGGLITLGDNSGVAFTDLAISSDPLVTHKRIYMSTKGGEVMYLVATLPAAATTAYVRGMSEYGPALRTQFMGPPPAGHVLAYYNGRIWVGNGRVLWYSRAHEYELVELASGFIMFDETVQTIAPVVTGIYLGTSTETVYLDGADPTDFVKKQVAPYGTVLGTETYVRNDIVMKDGVPGMAAVWMSKTGLCLGLANGEMKNLTSHKYIMPEAVEGASLMKIRSGTPQLVTTLFN